MHQSHYIELRLLLTCFYIYLNCLTLLYIKQVTFHYPLLSSPLTYPYSYIHFVSITGNCTTFIYRFLLLYALWYKMADVLLISIVFLTALICLRFTFDIYGYYSGYIKQSLYYPFDSFDKKSMIEEITDLIFLFVKNCSGLVLSLYMLTDIISDNRPRRSTKEIKHRSSTILEED